MSLVGPRPHALPHDQQFRALVPAYDARFAVRPGITGLAQLRGLRGETRTDRCVADRIEADLEYVRNWSIGLDFKILLRSTMIVFEGSGA